MRNGFTLVELSIVLVIIGLLISGILVGQSLIESAKISSFIRQIQQFDIAVSNFQTKFRGLPGDSSKLGCTAGTVSICDNGIIEMDDIGSCCSFSGEEANFWPHLEKSGFNYHGKHFRSNTSGPGGSAIDVTSNNPESPSIEATEFASGAFPQNCGYNIELNCYTIAYFTPDDPNDISTMNYAPMFSAANSLAIDTKLDDGLPYLGIVQNWLTAIDSGLGAYGCDDGTNYSADNDDGLCWMQIKMLNNG